MAGGRAQGLIGLDRIPGRLGIDDLLQRQHMGFYQISHHGLGQIRVGRAQEGPEVLRILYELHHCLVLLDLVFGCDTLRVVHSEANMLAPER
jgi:hypothetical protein